MGLLEALKELFGKTENGTLTYDEFEKAVKEKGIKLADLSEGNYVSKSKYDNDLSDKDKQITTLNNTIVDRDKDLEAIKTQLNDAGEDKSKLDALSTQLSDLQSKYDTDTKNYQAQLSKQAYEFAVKEYANTQQFTSNAAKRDFIKSMTDKNLQMDGDKILGADDFANVYFTDNADARVVVDNTNNNQNEPDVTPVPHFVNPTGGQDDTKGGDTNPFQFNFTGVRPHD